MRSRYAAALIVAVVSAATLAAGCGSGASSKPVKGAAMRHAAKPKVAALGAGPWTGERVTAFLRPAYAAMQDDLGELVVFTCTGGYPGFRPAGVPGNRVFACAAAFMGSQGMRQVSFDAAGHVIDEEGLPSTHAENPGVSCSSNPALEPEPYSVPACDDVETQVPDDVLPRADASLYGTAPEHSAEAGGQSAQAPAPESTDTESDGPGDCGPAGMTADGACATADNIDPSDPADCPPTGPMPIERRELCQIR